MLCVADFANGFGDVFLNVAERIKTWVRQALPAVTTTSETVGDFSSDGTGSGLHDDLRRNAMDHLVAVSFQKTTFVVNCLRAGHHSSGIFRLSVEFNLLGDQDDEKIIETKFVQKVHSLVLRFIGEHKRGHIIVPEALGPNLTLLVLSFCRSVYAAPNHL
jgi:hypothetical protein